MSVALISRKKYKEFGPGWRGCSGLPQGVPGGMPAGALRRQATCCREKKESVGKPGSVVDDHSSATGVTTCL